MDEDDNLGLDEEKISLELFREEYEELKKKYNLPEFVEMNRDFLIEKATESETYFPLREIGKMVADRIMNYFRFIENMLNPSNSSIFMFSVVKALSENDKKELSEMYKKLARIEIVLIELDLDYSEEKEAKFIREGFKLWQSIKIDLLKIIKKVENSWNKEFKMNGNSYLG